MNDRDYDNTLIRLVMQWPGITFVDAAHHIKAQHGLTPIGATAYLNGGIREGIVVEKGPDRRLYRSLGQVETLKRSAYGKPCTDAAHDHGKLIVRHMEEEQ